MWISMQTDLVRVVFQIKHTHRRPLTNVNLHINVQCLKINVIHTILLSECYAELNKTHVIGSKLSIYLSIYDPESSYC